MKYVSNIWLRCNLVLFSLIILFSVNGFSQQKVNELRNINEQVWVKFYDAFATLNFELMAEIHSKDLIRVSGGSQKILDFETYIDGYKKSFQNSKDENENREIELRFFERICNGVTASERGIYQLTINKGKATERKFFGQFHVIHKKELGQWKIFMDYDSNENDTIDQAAFDNAKSINEIKVW